MLYSHGDAAERQWSCYQAASTLPYPTVPEPTLPYHTLDTVWVQDYHLMLLPQYLRDASPSLSIGWFLHTPFVIADMYLTLPHREEILRGVLGAGLCGAAHRPTSPCDCADLCGFHIYEYAQHFTSACGQVLGIGGNTGVTQGPDGLFDHASRRSVAIDTFPIGIDPAPFERALDSSAVKDKIIDLQRRFDGKKVLLGIDRLDYVKGIPHKLKALEYFLGNYPAWRGKVVLVQIAVPSRTEVAGYQKLRANVHRLVSRINGTFGTLEYVPIHYLDQSMKFPELCALYYRADSMVVTSLRDGMNLVSFEYLACQTSKNAKGVLVLSEFAGAAQALGAGALLVNPYNVAEVARAIDESLNMPASEREERFEYLDKHIHGHTAQERPPPPPRALDAAAPSPHAEQQHPTSSLSHASQEWAEQFRSAGQRLLIFGLLGALSDGESSVRRNLAALAASPHNTLVVLSGRERALLNEWLGDLPIWLVAENGLWIRPPPGWESGGGGGGGAAASGSAASLPASTWEMVAEGVDDSWMASLKPIFKYFEARHAPPRRPPHLPIPPQKKTFFFLPPPPNFYIFF
ncbi:hypothetical protein EMIHUDRAFT_427087 [Emiliania huxleyi CCMP1516]|uniref:Trehalose-6-phosphate synthase n=2 Tax=Emiliania huxleyi TaxID=2903 RepID=A0A0D3JP09_EMIH1|nr:hypothetical protein EMIHUDRAFT_427087 [Emiliania huxleyi CCMP1516]EOD25244.1 hypothetical protein EMIHUDRAFT_427087 [Emiliania huxleyi CCMP1516]|eukprot:XP_005777673.1 hypothetical protein EMIHUDRAFT_427087 [Emiliania huxleyi CCMP1516]